MHANLASIMPQVIAVWCEQEGHEVTMVCYTGREDLRSELPAGLDILFISSFTQAALLAYSLSNYFRQQGTVTVLGGPHARCYPDDAIQYFDYVLGFTNQPMIASVLDECAPHRPVGKYLAANQSSPCEAAGCERALEVHGGDFKKSSLYQDDPYDRQHGLSLYLSFLYRFGGPLSAAGFPGNERRPAIPAD